MENDNFNSALFKFTITKDGSVTLRTNVAMTWLSVAFIKLMRFKK